MLKNDHLVVIMGLLPQITMAFAPVNFVKHPAQNPVSLSLKYKTEDFADIFAIDTKSSIVYHKILEQSIPVPEGTTFVGNLVDFLQNKYELPENLSMDYESSPCTCEDSRCILGWDAPLSVARDKTKMEVMVAGRYNLDDTETAMLIVKKELEPFSKTPPLMVKMFEESEKKIFQSLGRELDEFVSGKKPQYGYFGKALQRDLQRENTNKSLNAAKEPVAVELEAEDVEFERTTEHNMNQDAQKVPVENMVFDAEVIETLAVNSRALQQSRVTENIPVMFPKVEPQIRKVRAIKRATKQSKPREQANASPVVPFTLKSGPQVRKTRVKRWAAEQPQLQDNPGPTNARSGIRSVKRHLAGAANMPAAKNPLQTAEKARQPANVQRLHGSGTTNTRSGIRSVKRYLTGAVNMPAGKNLLRTGEKARQPAKAKKVAAVNATTGAANVPTETNSVKVTKKLTNRQKTVAVAPSRTAKSGGLHGSLKSSSKSMHLGVQASDGVTEYLNASAKARSTVTTPNMQRENRFVPSAVNSSRTQSPDRVSHSRKEVAMHSDGSKKTEVGMMAATRSGSYLETETVASHQGDNLQTVRDVAARLITSFVSPVRSRMSCFLQKNEETKSREVLTSNARTWDHLISY